MTNKAPSFQFFPEDWLSNLKLQLCSMTSQGLLINLMCLMHQSQKYGYLLINGLQINHKQLTKLLRMNYKTFNMALNELILCGVLKQDESGILYCKRMVDDYRLREIRREAGKLGGNPNLVNQKDNQSNNQNSTPSSSSSSTTSSSGNKTHKEVVVVENKSTDAKEATSNDDDIPEEVQTAGDVLVEKALSFSNKIPPYTPQSEEYKAATHILEIFTDLTGRKARSRKCIIDKLVEGYDEEMLIKHMKIKIKEDYYKKNPNALTPENIFRYSHIINVNINKKERKKKNIVLKDMIQSDGTRGDE